MVDQRDRFGRIEIPADRQVDLTFLDAVLALPRPLPIEEHVVAAFIGGRVWVPGAGTGRIHLYDLDEPLIEHLPDAVESAWRDQHARALTAATRSARGQVPVAILTDPIALESARAAVRGRLPEEIPDRSRVLAGQPAHTDGSALLRVVGHARLLRLHDKLYDLATLPEYVAKFSKAIEPDALAALNALPATADPADFLAVIANHLEHIHPKARSPLRNKMDTSRVVLGGITLLPLYVGPSRALFDRYAARLCDGMRLLALADR